MLTREDLQAISQLIKNEVEPINGRLDKMDGRLDKVESRLDSIEETLDEVKEDGQITRSVTNAIGEWIEFYFGKEKPYPLDKDVIEEQNKVLKWLIKFQDDNKKIRVSGFFYCHLLFSYSIRLRSIFFKVSLSCSCSALVTPFSITSSICLKLSVIKAFCFLPLSVRYTLT